MSNQVIDAIKAQEKRFSELGTEKSRGKIQLAVFSKSFFPMFVEYFVGKQEPNLNFWFSATGTSGYQYVDVIDNKGEVVFAVPPLFDYNTTESFNRSSLNPAEHMALVQIKDRNMPGSGNGHANAFFEEVVTQEKEDPKDIREFFNAWVTVFQYYGYTAKNASTDSVPSSEVNLSEDDYDGYEDL